MVSPRSGQTAQGREQGPGGSSTPRAAALGAMGLKWISISYTENARL